MDRVTIVGGGLAGLAAAVALAPRGFAVTVLEARPRLGGRASSFRDPVTEQLVDACQHVSMGCCTNFAHFCRTVGVDHLLEPQPTLYFQTPDRRVSRFRADPWPAPFHLGRALASAHYLTAREKLGIGYALGRMLLEPADADPPLRPWLEKHGQSQAAIDRFWGVVLTSALNETVDRVGLKYARKVFRDGFMTHRDGFVVQVPKVPLAELYGEKLRGWLDAHGVIVQEGAAVRSMTVEDSRIALVLRNASDRVDPAARSLTLPAPGISQSVILAVPFDRVLALLPSDIAAAPFFARIGQLQPSPITSVHVWLDRPVLDLPHVVLVDCLGQWVFNRGEVAPGRYYLQVVVSAARPLRGLGGDEIQARVLAELRHLYPAMVGANVHRVRVITEHTATFSAVPGVDALRPTQATPVPHLFLAGDWTATGWPATMEGAVRSGYVAAEALLASVGRPERLVQPDLSPER